MYIHKLNLAFSAYMEPLIAAVNLLAFIVNGWKCFLSQQI